MNAPSDRGKWWDELYIPLPLKRGFVVGFRNETLALAAGEPPDPTHIPRYPEDGARPLQAHAR